MIGQIARIFYYLTFINWLKVIRLQDKNASNVIVMFPVGFHRLYLYYIGNLVSDFCNIRYHVKRQIPFRIVFGNKFQRLKNKQIFIGVGKEFSDPSVLNYNTTIAQWIDELEANNNRVFFTSRDVQFWENKVFMHQEFDRLKINSPETKIIGLERLVETAPHFDYPYLVKWPHSAGSRDLYNIATPNDLEEVITKFKRYGNYSVLVQRRVNMTKDLRVIATPKEVVSSYWRINDTNEWRPTSTRRGSSVDFHSFPEQWRAYFLEVVKTLDLSAAAFDITWQDDDLSTEPLILEVSPSFSPNPEPPDDKFLEHYYMYKKKSIGRSSFLYRHLELQYKIREKVLDEYFRKIK